MNKYLSLQQIAKGGEYPFTIGQLRCFMIEREKNGLNHAVRKVGKRLYLKVDLFDKWIETHKE